MTRYVIDSYAWIEYLEGSTEGARVRDLLQPPAEAYTPTPVVAEVTSKAVRRGRDASVAWLALRGSSIIVPLDGETARAAGSLHAQYRRKVSGFAMTDAVVLTLARKLDAKIVTGDPHFRGMRGVEFLG
jgi:predicted nucleic acid-binding protein